MPTLERLFSNLKNYYVHSIDDMLIDSTMEQDPSDFANSTGNQLKLQPDCEILECFYSDQSDWNYHFNPKMPVCYCNRKGVVLVTDIYGVERQLKLVTNLQMTNQVFDNLLY